MEVANFSTKPAAAVPGDVAGSRWKDSDGSKIRRTIEVTVSAALGVSSSELQARTRRSATTAFARQIAMYLAHVVYGMSLTEAGRLFGRDRTTAAHACCIVEDRRDDPLLDHLLHQLECSNLRLCEKALGVQSQ